MAYTDPCQVKYLTHNLFKALILYELRRFFLPAGMGNGKEITRRQT